MHPDSFLNTNAHHDLPLTEARFRGTPEYFLAQFIVVSRHLALNVTRQILLPQLSHTTSIFLGT